MFIQSVQLNLQVSAIAVGRSGVPQSLLKLFESGILFVDRRPEVRDEVDVQLSRIRPEFCRPLQQFGDFVLLLVDPSLQLLPLPVHVLQVVGLGEAR